MKESVALLKDMGWNWRGWNGMGLEAGTRNANCVLAREIKERFASCEGSTGMSAGFIE